MVIVTAYAFMGMAEPESEQHQQYCLKVLGGLFITGGGKGS